MTKLLNRVKTNADVSHPDRLRMHSCPPGIFCIAGLFGLAFFIGLESPVTSVPKLIADPIDFSS